MITDGEFRRAYWHLDFMWGFNGVKEIELEHGYKFHGQETAPGSLALTGKITGTNHPFVEHFKFVKQFEDEHTTARQTIPAPSQFLAELFREDNGTVTRSFYPDLEELIQDIAAAYRQVIKDYMMQVVATFNLMIVHGVCAATMAIGLAVKKIKV